MFQSFTAATDSSSWTQWLKSFDIMIPTWHWHSCITFSMLFNHVNSQWLSISFFWNNGCAISVRLLLEWEKKIQKSNDPDLTHWKEQFATSFQKQYKHCIVCWSTRSIGFLPNTPCVRRYALYIKLQSIDKQCQVLRAKWKCRNIEDQ